MNKIKTQIYLRKIKITFDSYAFNIYAQNEIIEQFNRTIMKKTRIMRFLVNLFHCF